MLQTTMKNYKNKQTVKNQKQQQQVQCSNGLPVLSLTSQTSQK